MNWAAGGQDIVPGGERRHQGDPLSRRDAAGAAARWPWGTATTPSPAGSPLDRWWRTREESGGVDMPLGRVAGASWPRSWNVARRRRPSRSTAGTRTPAQSEPPAAGLRRSAPHGCPGHAVGHRPGVRCSEQRLRLGVGVVGVPCARWRPAGRSGPWAPRPGRPGRRARVASDGVDRRRPAGTWVTDARCARWRCPGADAREHGVAHGRQSGRRQHARCRRRPTSRGHR